MDENKVSSVPTYRPRKGLVALLFAGVTVGLIVDSCSDQPDAPQLDNEQVDVPVEETPQEEPDILAL